MACTFIVITGCKRRKHRCGICKGCLTKECGKCMACIDKPKFGGKGKQKQCCIHRRCEEIISKIAST